MQQIVIVQAGWVFVGDREIKNGGGGANGADDKFVELKNAACIRVWGTTAGLGQLALHGKQKDTVLDPCGTVQFPMSSVIGIMEVQKRMEVK